MIVFLVKRRAKMKDRSTYRRGSMARGRRGRRGRPVTGGARPSRPMPPRP